MLAERWMEEHAIKPLSLTPADTRGRNFSKGSGRTGKSMLCSICKRSFPELSEPESPCYSTMVRLAVSFRAG
jgi:hypothetical protein